MNNRRKMILLLALSVLALAGILYCEKSAYRRLSKSTANMTVDEMDVTPNIRFVLPKDENRGLSTDIKATIFNEDELNQYLIIPADASSMLTVYSVDAQGNLLNRLEINRNEEDVYEIGLRRLHVIETKLPIVAITIRSDSPTFTDLISSDKSVECYGDLTLSADKSLANRNHWIEKVVSKDSSKKIPGSITLRGRGNTTWEFSPKKSFTVVFEKSTYVLNMGKHKRWNLISNSQDKSLLKNEVFLQMASDMGIAYEPDTQQVTLYIDGEYQGVYLLTDKVNVAKDRINLKNGDFLVNWGGSNAEQPLFYDSVTWFDDGSDYSEPYANLEWPDNASEERKNSANELVQQFITAIENPEDDSYTDICDLDSMVKYYWAQEISMNYDAAFRSTYSYYRKDTGKFYMGPLWDMDLSIGLNGEKGISDFTTPEGFKIRNLSWYKTLFQREDFRVAVADAYFNGGVREAMFDAVDRFEARGQDMSVDGSMNYRRWRSDWPALEIRYGDSYEERVAGYYEFFKTRASWIDTQMQLEKAQ